jgi:TRAP-type C4-dicarboxylate transport system substrate-binding protein
MELAELENSIWESLSATQQQALLEAYEDSENENNLIPFSQIIEKYNNWA